MNVIDERSGDVLILHLNGRLDSSTSPEFEKRLLDRIDSGERRLVLEFAGLDYVSSAGLRILLMAAKRLRQATGTLVLCGLKPPIREVLEVSGFLPILNVCEDQAQAVAQAAA